MLGSVVLSACATAKPVGQGSMNHDMMNMGGMHRNTDEGPDTVLSRNNVDLTALPEAKPSEILEVKDGATIDLNPGIVKKTIDGKSFAFYTYNGQFPGPTIKVRQGSVFTVRVKNNIDQQTTVHWHGIRLDNINDGVPGVTQKAIEPGGSFTYTVKVPDEGMFWYHPHVREDMQQDMGLYGLLHVTPMNPDAYAQVDEERYMVLDDLLLQKGLPVPHGKTNATYALMGRFGNTFLVNGSTPEPLSISLGSTQRFAFLNASNTRTYRIVRPEGSILKAVGGDAGRYERDFLTDEIILSPSERTIVEITFRDDDVLQGKMGEKTVTLVESGPRLRPIRVVGAIIVGGVVGANDSVTDTAAENDDVIADIATFRKFFDKPVDHTLHLSVDMTMGHGMAMDHGAEDDGIEWEDTMPMMNAMATDANTQWKLIDEATGNENMDIRYAFENGEAVKIRIVNDADSAHPMQHPIHFHGQRFLVLSINGIPNKNLVWKDTVLVPKDATADILLDASNPGEWMIHCHIAEHLSNGMMGSFTVE